MKAEIKYDGCVNVSPHFIGLGDYNLTDIIRKALGINDDEYHMINADVTISIERKEDYPVITIEGDDEC